MSFETPVKRPEPTAAEAMFFYAIVKHTRNKADIDWTAVASEQGFKNAEVAKVRFGQVKRKLGINADSGNSPASAKTTPKKPTPNKVTKTPTGRAGTKGKAGKKKVKDEEEEGNPSLDDDLDEGMAAKKEEEDDQLLGVGGAPFHQEMQALSDPF